MFYYLGKCCVLFFFFFSSRRRHTRSLRDWSSDVCSSDLAVECHLHTVEVVGSNPTAPTIQERPTQRRRSANRRSPRRPSKAGSTLRFTSAVACSSHARCSHAK